MMNQSNVLGYKVNMNRSTFLGNTQDGVSKQDVTTDINYESGEAAIEETKVRKRGPAALFKGVRNGLSKLDFSTELSIDSYSTDEKSKGMKRGPSSLLRGVQDKLDFSTDITYEPDDMLLEESRKITGAGLLSGVQGRLSKLDFSTEINYEPDDVLNDSRNGKRGPAALLRGIQGGLSHLDFSSEINYEPDGEAKRKSRRSSMFDGRQSIFEALEEEIDVEYNTQMFASDLERVNEDENENVIHSAKSMGTVFNAIFRRSSDPTEYVQEKSMHISDRELQLLKQELREKGVVTNAHAAQLIKQKYADKITGKYTKKPVTQSRLSLLGGRKSINSAAAPVVSQAKPQQSLFDKHENFLSHATQKKATQRPLMRRASCCGSNVTFVEPCQNQEFGSIQGSTSSRPEYKSTESARFLAEDSVR